MGPWHRITTRRSQVVRLQNISYDDGGRRFAQRIHKRTIGEGVHTTIKIPLCVAILFHQKERREALTCTRLQKTQLSHHQEPVPTPVDPRTHRQTPKCHTIHKARYSLGIQQRPHQRGRPGERSLQDKPRTLRTLCHVLWTDKLPKHLPNHDGYHIPRSYGYRTSRNLHGRYPNCHPNRHTPSSKVSAPSTR